MGLFIHDDPGYDLSVRQTGFNRYKQLLSLHFTQWLRIHLLTIIGFLPLAAGIAVSILSSSLLLLLPCSLLGGAVAGPFLAGLYDAILRGLRDDPQNWKRAYWHSWRSNRKDSLLPGAVLGFFLGLYTFLCYLFWWAPPSPGTLALCLFSVLAVTIVNTLYWPQLVLFRQTAANRLRNVLLLTIRHFWRVVGAGVLQIAYIALYILFAPWTLLLVPVLGLWYILFLSQLLLYPQLDAAFHIEEAYGAEE